MDDKSKLWDAINDEFRARREELLRQLKELDVWYEEQFVLHDITSSGRG